MNLSVDPVTLQVGQTDQQMVVRLLRYVRYGAFGTPLSFDTNRIGGTGRVLGATIVPEVSAILNDTGPFSWGVDATAGQMIEQIDGVSVRSETDTNGQPYFGRRYITYETMNGELNRYPIGGRPRSTTDWTFTEGVDIERGSYGRQTSQLINAALVVGYDAKRAFGPVATIQPSGNPFQVSGWVPGRASSPMLEQEDEAIAASTGLGISTYAYAQYMLFQSNRELKTVTFITPRDDYFAPGQTILVNAPGRFGTGEPYWIEQVRASINRGGMWWQEIRATGGGIVTPSLDEINVAPPGADPTTYGGISQA